MTKSLILYQVFGSYYHWIIIKIPENRQSVNVILGVIQLIEETSMVHATDNLEWLEGIEKSKSYREQSEQYANLAKEHRQ